MEGVHLIGCAGDGVLEMLFGARATGEQSGGDWRQYLAEESHGGRMFKAMGTGQSWKDWRTLQSGLREVVSGFEHHLLCISSLILANLLAEL